MKRIRTGMHMKYRDGYLCEYDDLWQLPVDILEDIIIRIYQDSYLSRDAKLDLLKDYMDVRKSKLDKAFLYTDENTNRLREMNELIEWQSLEAIRTAYRIYQDELAEKAAHPDTYVDVEIKPMLKVPSDIYYNLYREKSDYIFTEKEERMWDILCSPYNHNYRIFDMLCSTATFYTSKPDANCEDVICDCVYGCDKDEEFTSWGDVMCLDREKVKDILFVRPYHNIYDFCCFAMSDLFKIKEFKTEIEITDEIL